MRIPRGVKQRLAALTAISVICAAVLGFVFLRVPDALGIGRYEIQADFRAGAGLYEGAEVTYRGTPVGKVSHLSLEAAHVVATLKLKSEFSVPSDVRAEIRSRSAVGEQYVELVPVRRGASNNSTLAGGDTIGLDRTGQPVEVGPLLDHVGALAETLNQQDVNTTVSELGASLDGRSDDLRAIIDHGRSFVDKASANVDATTRLIDDTEPLLTAVSSQQRGVVRLTDNLEQVTDELRAGDGDLRRLLSDGPGFSREVSSLLHDLDGRLPGLLKPLNAITDVLVVYDTHLGATLAEYPRSMATVQSSTSGGADSNKINLTLSNIADPAECLTGFLPTDQWLSPYEKTPSSLPPLTYCQEPKDDPRGARGARNIPCPNAPAIRTAEATECLDRYRR
jgi:phospholipid/cholesterol/gamma-HCH transport system substrate-binding protein